MKVVKIVLALIILVSSLTIGVYWGKHRTTTTNFVITAMEESVAKYENKSDTKNDAILDENSSNKAIIKNMYEKPVKISSAKENLMVDFKTASNKLQKVNGIKGMKVERVADEVAKANSNNAVLRDLLASIYAEIRQEKTKDDIQDFFKTEEDWGNKNLNESVEAGKTGKGVMEQEYYYYDKYNKELINKCSYLINNTLV